MFGPEIFNSIARASVQMLCKWDTESAWPDFHCAGCPNAAFLDGLACDWHDGVGIRHAADDPALGQWRSTPCVEVDPRGVHGVR